MYATSGLAYAFVLYQICPNVRLLIFGLVLGACPPRRSLQDDDQHSQGRGSLPSPTRSPRITLDGNVALGLAKPADGGGAAHKLGDERLPLWRQSPFQTREAVCQAASQESVEYAASNRCAETAAETAECSQQTRGYVMFRRMAEVE